MNKIFIWIAGIVLISFSGAVNTFADEIVAELELADGLNCPCKAEVIAPPPPPPPPAPPAAPANYYREAEVFGLSKHLLDGGNNVTSKGHFGNGPFATDVPILRIDDATEQWKMGGGRMTIGRFLDDQNAVEFTAMGFSHESHSFVVNPNPGGEDINAAFINTSGSFLPNSLLNRFTDAHSQSLNNDTRFISAELNLRRQVASWFSVLAGVRYAYFGDDLNLVSEDNGVLHAQRGVLNIDGSNHLVGLQVGGDMDFPLFSKLSLESGVKVGGFLNIAAIEDYLFVRGNNLPYQFEDTDVRGSAITEGRAALTWNFTDNVSASLGYMAMLLSWVTTAGENFSQANTAEEFQQHSSDHVLVHGPLARINVLLPPETLRNYYGSVEMFALNEQLLEGGDNLTTIGDEGAGQFSTGEPLRDIDDATREFDFGGGRLTVGRTLDSRDSVEFTVMGFSHQTDSFIEDSTRDLDAGWVPVLGNTTVFDGEFNRARQQILDYETVLFSGEINYRRQLTQVFSAIAGIRYASLVDDLRYISHGNLPVHNTTAFLTIESHNHLVGLQVGADMDVDITDKLSLDGGLKVGGFFNFATGITDIQDDDGNFFRSVEVENRASAITDGKLGLTWQFTPKISASLGYMAMLFSWVTSSGENFPQARSEAEFRKAETDHVLVHGPLARINIALP
ncbi:MAG: hypothetical protein ACQ9MH_10750 [Nitrospinales bacterium]